ncbi:MAG: LCP family protein [Treponema sp.]|nr:LCP family protein [Treponema sp.]
MTNRLSTNINLIFLLIILVILIVTSVFLVVFMQIDPIEEALNKDQILKTLIVLESAENFGEEKNVPKSVLFTGVLMYYPESRRVAMFDIPGNTGSIYSSLGQSGRTDRIDAVYLDNGIDSYKNEIEKMLGTTIPFYLVMNLEQFSVLTDLLGGLRVFISSPVDTSVDGVHYLLPSGAVNLDGDKICTFLEYNILEETDSELQERRQMAILAFLMSLNKKSSEVFNKKVFSHYAENFQTSLNKNGLYRLLKELATIDAERLVPQTITGSLRNVDGKTLLFPFYDGQLIKDICKQTMSALVVSTDAVYERTYVLEIQNGTFVQGLARNTAALLQNVGYDVLSMKNAETQDYEKTVIIDHIGNPDIAKSLGAFITCDNIKTEEIKTDEEGFESASLVDFTIILGKDFDGRYVR